MADEREKLAAPQDQESVKPEGRGAILLRGTPMGNTPSKTSWPEVVGLTAEDAEKKIREEMPRVSIQLIQPDQFVTMDFNPQRVRLYLDPAGSVDRIPKLG